MQSKIKQIVNLMFLIFACVSTTSAQTYIYKGQIKGRLVDKNGRAVPNASLTYELSDSDKEKSCGMQETYIETDTEGRFIFSDKCDATLRNYILFTIPKLPSNAKPTILPTFWDDIRASDSRYAGTNVVISGNETSDIGDIQIQLLYAPVELFVLDKRGKPYFKTLKDWDSFFRLVVKDKFDDVVDTGRLSDYDLENRINLKKGSIMLVIPQGTWRVGLTKDFESDINILAETEQFSVVDDKPMRVYLRLKTNRR